MFDPIFKPFIEKSPISVMARGMLERVVNPDLLDEWFDSTAKEQYTRDLLFSTVFDLMSKVVSGSYKSVHSAYQAAKEDISVSITSIYNKINGIEPDTSAELVRFASSQVQPIIRELGGSLALPVTRETDQTAGRQLYRKESASSQRDPYDHRGSASG